MRVGDNMKEVDFSQINSKKYMGNNQKKNNTNKNNYSKPKNNNNNNNNNNYSNKREERYDESFLYDFVSNIVDEYQQNEQKKINEANYRQDLRDIKDSIDTLVNKIWGYVTDYVYSKRKKGFLGNIFKKIFNKDKLEEEKEEWIEEAMESSEVEFYMNCIENLLEKFYDNYEEDLSDYVEEKLGSLADYF